MNRGTGRTRIAAGSSHATLLCRMLLALLAAMLLPTVAARAAGSNAPLANPHLASLQIEIWPEYDRPAVLVILKGELAPNVTLPAKVSVRIPAASGGPSAVASSSAASGDLLNAKYESEAAGERITLKFQVPERVFHIEFYEPIATSAPQRNYTYTWPGDLATDRLAVIAQEPAGVTDLAATPALQATATGQDGLRYRSAELGAFAAGKQVDLNVRYTKTDARTSTAILNPRAEDAQTKVASPIPAAPESSALPFAIPSKKAAAILLAAVVAVLALGGIAAVLWGSRRKNVPDPQPAVSGVCRKCRAPVVAGDRFCPKCGEALA